MPDSDNVNPLAYKPIQVAGQEQIEFFAQIGPATAVAEILDAGHFMAFADPMAQMLFGTVNGINYQRLKSVLFVSQLSKRIKECFRLAGLDPGNVEMSGPIFSVNEHRSRELRSEAALTNSVLAIDGEPLCPANSTSSDKILKC